MDLHITKGTGYLSGHAMVPNCLQLNSNAHQKVLPNWWMVKLNVLDFSVRTRIAKLFPSAISDILVAYQTHCPCHWIGRLQASHRIHPRSPTCRRKSMQYTADHRRRTWKCQLGNCSLKEQYSGCRNNNNTHLGPGIIPKKGGAMVVKKKISFLHARNS